MTNRRNLVIGAAAAGAGSLLIPSRRLFAQTITQPAFVPSSSIYNVKKPPYNAVGNGTADDSTAVSAAVNACYTSGGGVIYFPQGVYRVTQNNVLGNFPAPNASGKWCDMQYWGEGGTTSVVQLDTTSAVAPTWLMQNLQTNTTMAAVTFKDLGFWGAPADVAHNTTVPTWLFADIPQYSYGFQFYGATSGPQVNNYDILFERCYMGGIQGGFDFEGTNHASEITHIGCHYECGSYVYLINNIQSVNHRMFGCDLSCFGDILQIGSTNGSGFAGYGCSVNLAYPGSGTTNTYLINANSNSITNGVILWSGLRAEFQNNYSNLGNINGGYPVVLEGCFIYDHATSGTKSNWCPVAAGSFMVIRDSILNTGASGGAVAVVVAGKLYLTSNVYVPTNFVSADTSVTGAGVITVT